MLEIWYRGGVSEDVVAEGGVDSRNIGSRVGRGRDVAFVNQVWFFLEPQAQAAD